MSDGPGTGGTGQRPKLEQLRCCQLLLRPFPGFWTPCGQGWAPRQVMGRCPEALSWQQRCHPGAVQLPSPFPRVPMAEP